MSVILSILNAIESGLPQLVALASVPPGVVTVGTLATGLASIGAILSYPGAAAIEPGAESSPAGPWSRLKARLKRMTARRQAFAAIDDLDTRMLHDIGLTRGDIACLSMCRTPETACSDRFVFRPDI